MAPPDEGSPVAARSENDPAEPAQAYGPIMLIRRYAKDDGRALILYSRETPRVAPEDPERIEGPRA